MKQYLKILVTVFKPWLPLGVAITVTAFISYGVAQQTIRLLANDPQVQIAEDLTNIMNAGQSAQNIFPPTYTVDIAKSLAPFVVMYDDTGVPVAGSARFDGVLPTIPKGVLDYTRDRGQDRITWQPQKGVRSAIVVSKYSSTSGNGFIMVGRSLRESERQQLKILHIALLGWLAGLVLTFAAQYLISGKRE